MKSIRWRLILIAALTVWGAYSVLPSVYYFQMPPDKRNDQVYFEENLPEWLPKTRVALGLDLQGGVQMVLGVDTEQAIATKLGRIGTEVLRWKDEESIPISTAYVPKGEQVLRVELAEGADLEEFRKSFRDEFPGFQQVDREDRTIDYAYNDDQMKEIKKSAIEQAERVVRNRVDKWGVSEPLIARRANNSIMVQLPGFSDTAKAKELLGTTAQLKFKIVDDVFKGLEDLAKNLPEGITADGSGGQMQFVSEDREAILKLVEGKIPEDRELLFEREELASGKYRFRTYVVEAATQLTGDDILDAFAYVDSSELDQRPAVSLKFTGPGGKRFADVTGANVNRRLAIILDDEINSAPNIEQKISGGSARITLGGLGNYQKQFEEANQLSLILKSGALPAKITIEEERQVGASLGPELASQGIRATVLGLIMVLIFMLFYYRRPGIIACIALSLNGLFLLALMSAFGFALTLPGIAGFILTLGMAVDANVLINERIKQELAEGKNARKAVENGFEKVFWTIVDANVTTLIAALVLLETNSSGPIKGFAITLMLGLIVSMFTSLFCSRTLFTFALNRCSTDKQVRAWLGGARAARKRNFQFSFLRYGPAAAVIGLTLVAAVIVGSATKGVNWSVDFAGGTEIEVGFDESVEAAQVRQAGQRAGLTSLTVQAIEDGGDKYVLRFHRDKKAQGAKGLDSAKAQIEALRTELNGTLGAAKPEFRKVDFVGPRVGRELRNQGMLSVLYAIIGVLLYIGLRFDARFAPGAIIKMVQDIFIIIGFYVFFNFSFDLTSVAAILTVVGYSVNDTIVIYDRIRENLRIHPRRSLTENINSSLNETLSRTLNTSITTVIALAGILTFGTQQIWTFAAAMTIGVIAATLSSQFLASSLIIWLQRFKKTGGGGKVQPAHA